MKAPIIFYMLLGLVWFGLVSSCFRKLPNEETPLPQEHPLPGNLPLNPPPKTYEAECECADGSKCDGTCSCSCISGTCIAGTDGFIPFIETHPSWDHCSCPDGSTCQGLKSCHCDIETGSCIAFNDCGPIPTTDNPDPVTTNTNDPEPDTTTEDYPEPDTTTNTEFVCDKCWTEDCCDTPITDYCEDCWINNCCTPPNVEV